MAARIPLFKSCKSLGAFRRASKHVLSKRCLNGGIMPPLNEPLPNMPPPPTSMVCGTEWENRHDHLTHVTTLENGIKVASQDSFGQFSTVGGNFLCFEVKLRDLKAVSSTM